MTEVFVLLKICWRIPQKPWKQVLQKVFKIQWKLRQKRQGVQGLQAFAFCVVHAIDEHMERKFKERLRVKFKDDISAEWRLKLWFESDW